MTFRQFLLVVEIRTKVISVSTYLLATLYAAASGHGISWIAAVLLAVAMLCVDMGTTAFNTFYDYVRGVDTPLLTVEPDKVLVHEGVAPAHAFLVSAGLYAMAAGTGIAVAVISSWWILVAGAAGMLVGFLYNGGPLPISRTPLGELFAGGFLGSVLFLVVYAVHSGRIDAPALVASVPSTLMIAAVLTVNNTCDIEGDREAGRRTLSIVLGRPAAGCLIAVLCVGAYAMIVPATSRIPSPSFIRAGAVGVGLLASAVMLAGMHRRGFHHRTKHPNMVATIRIVLIYTIAYAGTLVPAIVRG